MSSSRTYPSSSSSRRHDNPSSNRQNRQTRDTVPDIPSVAYIQAYEAQLVYDRPDLVERFTQTDTGGPSSTRGTLIRWGGDDEENIWVDRYDILHLLSVLPSTTQPTQGDTSPSSSWASLPSDTEDTFDLTTQEEIEAHQSAKRRKWMEALREDRLRVRDEEEEQEEAVKKRRKEVEEGREGWEGDDETPLPAILTLMSHTALSLSSSPNPKILEMRILANHAKDDRFSFLRGRYRDVWERIKKEVSKGKRDAEREKGAGLGGLMGGYGSDSDDKEQEGEEREVPPEPDDLPPLPPAERSDNTESAASLVRPDPPMVSKIRESEEDVKRRIRREKAEEWKRQRASAQSI